MKPPWKSLLIMIALAGAAIVLYVLWIALNTPTGADHDRTNAFARTLEQRHPFPVQRADGKGPAVYTLPNSFHDHILIYGDLAGDEIHNIESAARKIQSDRKEKKKVILSFYRVELDSRTFYHRTTIK
jgi:hypothetical protein